MSNLVVEQQLQQLQSLDLDSLRVKYEELFHRNPGLLGEKFMRQRCAYRIQELYFGGLTAGDVEALLYLAQKDPKVNPETKVTGRIPPKGIIYTREYKGQVYEMRAVGNGRFEYNGSFYNSPTSVARVITGQHVNGRVFWGIGD